MQTCYLFAAVFILAVGHMKTHLMYVNPRECLPSGTKCMRTALNCVSRVGLVFSSRAGAAGHVVQSVHDEAAHNDMRGNIDRRIQLSERKRQCCRLRETR